MIESKVKWASALSFAAGIVIAVLNAVQDSPGMLGSLPIWAQSLILALAPGLVAFLGGYAAPHTSRR